MKIVKVNLKKRSYDIIIGYNITGLLGRYISKLNLGSDAYVITTSPIKNRYGAILNKALQQSGIKSRFRVVPDSEKSKSIEIAASVIKDIAHYDRKKRLFIIGFGGGMVGDLSGFIASVYKRGTPYIQIPTTLLAQVDSSIGGKTAVDLTEGKNLIGAFYQPRLVFSDIRFLKSLSQRQLSAGLAEIIKYGIIKDSKLFAYLEKRYREILSSKPKALGYVIANSSRIKADIVGRDEREERGIRTILNFGHTIGHALEAAGNFRTYNHGEAIALGMVIASDISRLLNLINGSEFSRIERLIKAVGLPVRIKKASLDNIINAHYRDKKFIGSKNRFVLISGIGRARIKENISLSIIKEAIKKRF